MKKPFIVGIAGGSASGKSTFCDILEKELASLMPKIIHMDSYFKPEEERPFLAAPVTGKMYLDDNCPDTIDLTALKADLQEAIASGCKLIILEGLLVLWDSELYAQLDLKLFVDCRPDERIVRRLKRNMNWGLSFDEISNVYLDMVRYRHDEYVEPTKWKADIILNGSSHSPQAASMVTSFIKANCQ